MDSPRLFKDTIIPFVLQQRCNGANLAVVRCTANVNLHVWNAGGDIRAVFALPDLCCQDDMILGYVDIHTAVLAYESGGEGDCGVPASSMDREGW
jgi:hypothetical protein